MSKMAARVVRRAATEPRPVERARPQLHLPSTAAHPADEAKSRPATTCTQPPPAAAPLATEAGQSSHAEEEDPLEPKQQKRITPTTSLFPRRHGRPKKQKRRSSPDKPPSQPPRRRRRNEEEGKVENLTDAIALANDAAVRDGIQMRMNSWQDGVTGTNCPIPPGWNWTYQFQLKDQIGSFFYFPSLGLQRAAGGYGPVTVNNRAVVPVPFDQPDGDVTLFIGDWYTKRHTELREMLDDGKDLGIPDGILINAKGPYRYDTTLVPEGLQYEIVGVEPGKTYRFRVHNVGTSTSLNFRIQNHNMLLIEAEGTYTNQQNYTNLDIHVGQSYSFLVTMDQNASKDYYIVASPRFVSNETRWHDVNGVAILQYSNSKGSASGPLPDAPNDFYDKYYSMNQARSIRMNVSSGAARPNPQGSFRYGSINITQTFVLQNESPLRVDGKHRRTINRVSYSPPETPLRLADLHNLTGVYKTDFPTTPSNAPPRRASSVLNASYKGFLEIIFQNNETDVQTYHMDGYSFFVVGMDYGEWTPNSRGSYNKWDAVSRSTTQVFPGGWTAVLVSLDNVGIWNVRAEKLDNWYNGQEVYVKVADPLGYNVTEMIAPENTLYCGLLEDMQKPQIHQTSNKSSGHAVARWSTGLLTTVSLIVTAVICI